MRLVAPRGVLHELLEERHEGLDEARVGLRRGQRRRRRCCGGGHYSSGGLTVAAAVPRRVDLDLGGAGEGTDGSGAGV